MTSFNEYMIIGVVVQRLMLLECCWEDGGGGTKLMDVATR